MKRVWMAFTLAAMTINVHAADEASAPEQARSLDTLTATCAACHGPTGVSENGSFPIIASQHPSYLERALLDYQSGARKNAIMAGQVATLSKAEIKALAAWYASQDGPLKTMTTE